MKDAREATRDLWGDAGVEATMDRLDDEARRVFAVDARVDKWVPERIFMAWMQALWSSVCREDADELARWSDRITDRGFGTAQRMLLSLASPWLVLRRADALWHSEHTHGTMVMAPLDTRSARLTLHEHPFLTLDVARAALSEALRYILVLTRAKGVTETHEVAPNGAMHVTLAWR
jgi:hypothetical protein